MLSMPLSKLVYEPWRVTQPFAFFAKAGAFTAPAPRLAWTASRTRWHYSFHWVGEISHVISSQSLPPPWPGQRFLA
jgi:hypothetical protein